MKHRYRTIAILGIYTFTTHMTHADRIKIPKPQPTPNSPNLSLIGPDGSGGGSDNASGLNNPARRSSGGAAGRRGGGRSTGGGVSSDYTIGFGPNGAYRDFSEGGEGGSPINLGPLFGDVESIRMTAGLGSHFMFRGQDILSRYAQADGSEDGGMAFTHIAAETNAGWSMSFAYLTSMQSDYIFPPSVGGLTPDSRLGAYSEANFTIGKKWEFDSGFYGSLSNELIYFPRSDAWDSSFMNGFSVEIGQTAEISDDSEYEISLTATQFFGESDEVTGTALTFHAEYTHRLGKTNWFDQEFAHALNLKGDLYADKDFNADGETGLAAADLSIDYNMAVAGWIFNATAGHSFDLTDEGVSANMRDGIFGQISLSLSF